MTLPYEHCVNIIQIILKNTVKSDKMYKNTRLRKLCIHRILICNMENTGILFLNKPGEWGENKTIAKNTTLYSTIQFIPRVHCLYHQEVKVVFDSLLSSI